MKKILSLFALAFLISTGAYAQLPEGSTAPDWTLTDINGVEHTLYDYLNDGYTVVIDFSATWCGPCWNYHTSGALEELYINHGPAGMPNVSENTTNDFMVFFIEGDASTTNEQLNGGAGSQGDWVENTPYPIIDDASLTNAWVEAWPTIYTICPNGTLTISGQRDTDSHYDLVGFCALESFDTSTSTVQDATASNDFTFIAPNTNTEDETFKVTLTTDQPTDWAATMTAAGESASDELTFVAAGGTTETVTLNVVAGDTPAFATYTIEFESITDPDAPHYFLEYNVLSGITDLIVENGGVASSMNQDFRDGLDLANSTTYGLVSTSKFLGAVDAGQLSEVEHIYYNFGWTFPSLTNDIVEALIDFQDNGGNVMVSGQDIGWDTFDASTAANGTAVTQAYYTDYLRAEYVDDGSDANSQLTWNPDNGVFLGLDGSNIVDIHDGNIYPDQLDPINGSVGVYYYNNDPTKVGAVRSDEDGHKVVYLGIDIAMIQDENVRDEVIRITHDWFHGLITGIEFDERLSTAFGQPYPNPASEITTIPFSDLKEDVTLQVMDINGRVVFQDNVRRGSNNYQLNVSKLSAGTYQCVMTTDNGDFVTLPLEVVR